MCILCVLVAMVNISLPPYELPNTMGLNRKRKSPKGFDHKFCVCANSLTLLTVNPPTHTYGICCLAPPGLHKKHCADLFFLRLHQRLYNKYMDVV